MIQPKLSRAQRLALDEYARVRAKVMGWQPPANPHAARFEELAEKIQGWFEDEAADQDILATGYRFSVPVSARKKTRSLINVPGLLKRLGTKWIVDHFRPNLGELDKVLSAEEMPAYVKEERKGPRIIGEPVTVDAA